MSRGDLGDVEDGDGAEEVLVDEPGCCSPADCCEAAPSHSRHPESFRFLAGGPLVLPTRMVLLLSSSLCPSSNSSIWRSLKRLSREGRWYVEAFLSALAEMATPSSLVM